MDLLKIRPLIIGLSKWKGLMAEICAAKRIKYQMCQQKSKLRILSSDFSRKLSVTHIATNQSI